MIGTPYQDRMTEEPQTERALRGRRRGSMRNLLRFSHKMMLDSDYEYLAILNKAQAERVDHGWSMVIDIAPASRENSDRPNLTQSRGVVSEDRASNQPNTKSGDLERG